MTTPNPVQPTTPGVPEVQPQESQVLDQAAVDRIVSERVARERKKYEGFDELKAKAARFDEIEAQNATELEKAVKAADTAARADVSGKANAILISAEVRALAAEFGFNDPRDAAVQLRDRLSGIKVTEDGEVDSSAAKALVDELAKSKPYLVKTGLGRPQPLPGQGHHQQAPNAGLDQAREQARKRGFTKDG